MAATDLSRLPPEEQRHIFVDALFRDLPGYPNLRLVAEGKRTVNQTDDVQNIKKVLSNGATDGRNVWVGPVTRGLRILGKDEGDKTKLAMARALWVDFDDEAEKLDADLKRFPHPPSMVINSGNGVHLYWLLAKPFDLSTEANRHRFECILKGLAAALRGDQLVTDAPHVMRVPGTTNHPNKKKRDEGRVEVPAVLLEHHPDRTYSLGDFAEFERCGEALHTAKGRAEVGEVCEEKPFTGDLPASVKTLLDKTGNPSVELLRARLQGDTTGLKDPSDSGIDMSVIITLLQKGISDTDTIHTIRYRREEAGARERIDSYFTDSVKNGKAWIAGEAEKEKTQQQQRKKTKKKKKTSKSEQEDTDTDARIEDNTDAGAAAAFIRHHGEDLRYCNGIWYVWDGTRWRRDDTDEMCRRWLKTSDLLAQEATEEKNDLKRRDELWNMAKRCRSARGQREASQIAAADSEVVVRPNELDSDPWLFNCANGTLDLRTRRFRKPRREDLITKVSPIAYDRNAKASTWDKFLRDVQPDPKQRAFLQRCAGYTLVGNTREECMIIVYGLGCNGKTTFLERLRDVFGPDYAVELPADALTLRKFGEEMDLALGFLPGKRLATTMELPAGRYLNDPSVKRVTSGEPLHARKRYCNPVEFIPQCTLWTATNHKPRVSGDDDAIWRRLRLILFDQKIPEEKIDQNLAEKLRAELPGILAWVVRGCWAWQKKRLSPPKSVLKATQEYRSGEDWFAGFLDECCDTSAPQAWTATTHLTAACRQWSKRMGGGYAPSPEEIGNRLGNHGFTRKAKHRKRGWYGLRLTPQTRAMIGEDLTNEVGPALFEKNLQSSAKGKPK